MLINTHVKVTACVDRTERGARRFAALFRIKNYSHDYDWLLKNHELDAVYLALPHHLHAPMIEKAIKCGLHVFCEKPVTLNLAEGIRVLGLAEKMGTKVGVNYQYRYDKACYSLYSAASKGHLGTPHYALCHLPWKRDLKYFKDGPWRGKFEQAGGGTLLTQGSHILDVAIWAMGSEVVAAMGTISRRKFTEVGVEDLAMGILELKNGSRISITSSMAGHREGSASIEIHGSKGSALYKGPLLPRFSSSGKNFKRDFPPVKGLNAFTRSLEGFRLWVSEDLPYLCPIEESLKVLAAVEAIYKSADTGKKENVQKIIYPQK